MLSVVFFFFVTSAAVFAAPKKPATIGVLVPLSKAINRIDIVTNNPDEVVKRIAGHPIEEERLYFLYTALHTAMHRDFQWSEVRGNVAVHYTGPKGLRFMLNSSKNDYFGLGLGLTILLVLYGGIGAVAASKALGENAHSPELPTNRDLLTIALPIFLLVAGGGSYLSWYPYIKRWVNARTQELIYGMYESVSAMVDAAVANGLADEELVREWDLCSQEVDDLWDSSDTVIIARGNDRFGEFFDMIASKV